MKFNENMCGVVIFGDERIHLGLDASVVWLHLVLYISCSDSNECEVNNYIVRSYTE